MATPPSPSTSVGLRWPFLPARVRDEIDTDECEAATGHPEDPENQALEAALDPYLNSVCDAMFAIMLSPPDPDRQLFGLESFNTERNWLGYFFDAENDLSKPKLDVRHVGTRSGEHALVVLYEKGVLCPRSAGYEAHRQSVIDRHRHADQLWGSATLMANARTDHPLHSDNRPSHPDYLDAHEALAMVEAHGKIERPAILCTPQAMARMPLQGYLIPKVNAAMRKRVCYERELAVSGRLH